MSTSSRTTTTERHVLSDEERNLPETCPSWCTTNHAQDYFEVPNMWAACQHRGYLGDVFLPELRNGTRVLRPGDGTYDVSLVQDPNPYSNQGGGVELVQVQMQEGFESDSGRAELRLTTGEARVLAAKLLAAADRVDVLS